MSWVYDSGGKDRDDEKYKENYERIYKDVYDEDNLCVECRNPRPKGHKMDCSKNWRNL